MKNIVITSGTAVGSALSLAQSIAATKKCKVYVLCTDKKASNIIGLSKFVDKVIYINAEDECNYITQVQNWHRGVGFTEKPVLYFTTDTSCFYIDNHRDWFNEYFTLCMPSSEIIQTFTQKGLAEVKAAEFGLIVPRTQVIKNKSDISTVIYDFNFPVILKPRATYLKDGLNFKIKVIQDKQEFKSFAIRHISMNSSLLCQEFIPGDNDTSYYYLFYRNKNGDLFESMGKKTLQSTSNGGIMLKGKGEFNKNLSRISKSFLNNIDYQGIGGIEYKKYNNQFYFIEMSVRLEGFFKLNEISHSNLSLISYMDITNESSFNKVSQPSQEDGYIYIDFLSTFINHVKNRAYKLIFSDIFQIVFNSKVKLNVFSKNDCKPFFYQLISTIKSNK